MSRVILVVGVGRSGTSAVAGIMHRLGVFMGDSFVSASDQNKYGTFEDKEFFELNRLVIDQAKPVGVLQEFVSKRSEEHPDIWGLKDPALVHTIGVLGIDKDDLRVIVCGRNKNSNIRSLMRAYGYSEAKANEFYADSVTAISQNLPASTHARNVYFLDYETLLSNKKEAVNSLVEFVFEGLERPSEEKIWSAITSIKGNASRWDEKGKWIRRTDRKYDGWGKIGIGLRIAKHPEYHFTLSWTQLLTGGVRKGDRVLMPRGFQPAHWAANALMRDFISSDLDTLLLVDDDMVFSGDFLDTIRDNEESWEYDIVSGVATKRSWPPRAIVLRLKEEQPGLPSSLLGDTFDFMDDVPDNEVVEVDATGFAFTLIRRHVIEEMTGEYGPDYTFYCSYGNGFESEDVVFCRNARELGFRIAVDTNVKPGHVSQDIYGWNEYRKWFNSLKRPDVVEFDGSDLAGVIISAMPHLEGEEKERARNLLGYIGVDYD